MDELQEFELNTNQQRHCFNYAIEFQKFETVIHRIHLLTETKSIYSVFTP
jgi:hypothetical protein